MDAEVKAQLLRIDEAILKIVLLLYRAYKKVDPLK